jgi:hypothetical protein
LDLRCYLQNIIGHDGGFIKWAIAIRTFAESFGSSWAGTRRHIPGLENGPETSFADEP